MSLLPAPPQKHLPESARATSLRAMSARRRCRLSARTSPLCFHFDVNVVNQISDLVEMRCASRCYCAVASLVLIGSQFTAHGSMNRC